MNYQEILDFWFDPKNQSWWFSQNDAFDALIEEGGIINYGIYLVAGEACGIYTRLQAGPTDGSALSVPLLVRAS